MEYIVTALSVGGKRKVFFSGKKVKDTDFIEGRAEQLVEQGFLKRVGQNLSTSVLSTQHSATSQLYKKDFRTKDEAAFISVGLPVYASKIAWLAMEGLCAQQTAVKWELIVYEDADEALGERFFKNYLPRLKNCVRISYLYDKNRIPLTVKWVQIANYADENSVGIILQAADCYSEPQRIQTSYELFMQGYDWIQNRYGIFYNILTKQTMLFDGKDGMTMLNMAVRKSKLQNLAPDERWAGVDNWMLRQISKPVPAKVFTDESDNWKGGVDTDGYNRISLGRRKIYFNPKPPFYKTEMKITDLLPKSVVSLFEKNKPLPLEVLNICTHDWANLAYNNTKSLLAAGIGCEGYKLRPHKFNYPCELPIIDQSVMLEKAKQAKVVQIFHSDISLYKMLKDLGLKIVIWHTGTGYRENYRQMNALFNPGVFKTFTDQTEFMQLGAKDMEYVATAIDTDEIEKVNYSGEFKIAHYPSCAETKGTTEIVKMISELKERKFIFSVDTQNLGHDQQLQRMAQCDVYIELFKPFLNNKPYGCFGVTAFEAAALGKIVVTQNMNEQVYEQAYGFCPFLMAKDEVDFKNRINWVQNLKPKKRKELQNETRKWVMQHHSFKATGKRMIKLLEL